jgi:Protein phosphatase 2C
MGSHDAPPAGVDGASRWSPLVVGRGTGPFTARPPHSGRYYRPDTVCDGWATELFTVRVASVRGYAHRSQHEPRQDDAAALVHPPTGAVTFAVGDGVSAATQSHIGSTVACQAAVSALLDALDADPERLDWEDVLHITASRLVEHAQYVLDLPTPDPIKAEEQFATTLVAGVIRPAPASQDAAVATMVQVGDTSAWILLGGCYRSAFGESGNDPYLVNSAVTPLPRLPVPVRPRNVAIPGGGVLLIGTDGFGVPLGDGTGRIGKLFADGLTAPPPALELAHVLDFSRETFDDDRTLIAIWPNPQPASGRGKQ